MTTDTLNNYTALMRKPERSVLSKRRAINAAKLRAQQNAASVLVAGGERSEVLPQNVEDMAPLAGAEFTIPLVIPEGVESGDGRTFKSESLTMREMPLPLMWQLQKSDGHDGSVLVGRIDRVERIENGLGNAYGVFDTGPYGQEAQRLVETGMLRFVSADLDQFSAKTEASTDDEQENKGEIKSDKMTIKTGRLMGVTLVAMPAFQECTISLVSQEPEIDTLEDGDYVADPADEDAHVIVAAGNLSLSIPVNPPAEWFDDPKFTQPTAIKITEEGRVFGHIASWDIDHIGLGRGTRAPRSSSNYAYFHTGEIMTADGNTIPVGQLTLAGGHAGLHADALAAVKHYDDTGSGFADVHAGEDRHGIWVAGALRPSITPEQIRVARASAPSGDWRPIRNRLELVAVCQVNVPGFPVTRARVASGHVMALVAAGTAVLSRMQHDPMAALSNRIAELESDKLSTLEIRRRTISDRMNGSLAQRAEKAQLRMRVAAARSLTLAPVLPTSTLEERHAAALARMGGVEEAGLKDRFDVVLARLSLGEHVIAPDAVVLASGKLLDLEVDAYVTQFKTFDKSTRDSLAKEKKALPDGSFPIENESDLKNAIKACGRAKSKDRAKVRRHIMRRARALGQADLIPDDWKAASLLSPEEFAQFAVGDGDNDLRQKYTPDNQPRDNTGKFRRVLARLKINLGSDEGSQEALKKVEEAEQLENSGDVVSAAKSGVELIKLVDDMDTNNWDDSRASDLRSSAKELGGAVAYLPLAFGKEAEKIRYSDLPPATQALINDLIKRVTEKLGPEKLAEALAGIKAIMSGQLQFSQEMLSEELARLLAYLT